MIKDGKIYSDEINKWVDISEMLQEIVDVAADTMEHDAELKFVHCSDVDGNRHGYPTIKTFTKYKTDDVCRDGCIQHRFDMRVKIRIGTHGCEIGCV